MLSQNRRKCTAQSAYRVAGGVSGCHGISEDLTAGTNTVRRFRVRDSMRHTASTWAG